MKNSALNLMTPLAIASMALAGCNQSKPAPESKASSDGLDRTVLPVKEPVNPAITELGCQKCKSPCEIRGKGS